MKNYLFISAIALASCSGNVGQTGDNSDMDTSRRTMLIAEAESRQYCFMRTEGTQKQDTTTVHLMIKGNDVEGDMNWLPSEKDSRHGKLKGTISEGRINAVWTYTQEGMEDSVAVAFRLAPEELMQKPLKFNASTKKEETDNDSDFIISYRPYEAGIPAL